MNKSKIRIFIDREFIKIPKHPLVWFTIESTITDIELDQMIRYMETIYR